jgi:segregation and condensation protein B
MSIDSELLKRIVEAAILAAGQPLSIGQLEELFDEAERPTHTEFAKALETLCVDCAGRGVELVEVASGFRYQVKSEVHAHVARLWTERQSRYSRALMETLALIAYRQPITRGEIEAVRGVAVSTQIVKTLEEREWVRVIGHRDVPGRPALFGTTRTFLDYFGLKSLDQLPTLAEIRDLDALEPEFAFPSRKVTDADVPPAPLSTAPLQPVEVPSTETRQ